ncbi:MAG TPA: type II toxin-antitoxin system VapC family toxin [Acidobacteriota bacterium]
MLLDTDAYSALMRGHDAVSSRVREAEQILLSAIVAGELLFGFRSGSRFTRNRNDLEAFLRNPYVDLIPVTWVTAERFGRIAAALRAKGKPIPTNDIWIGAHALETGADLLSFDQHYQHIDGIAWIDPSRE